MITPKRLIEMARKWHKMIAKNRKRITFPRKKVASKGNFVVYTSDKRRFMIPLEYLGNDIFRELFRMAEEEFGMPSDGPITLPCESTFLDYVIALVQGHAPEDLEKALVTSMSTCRCSSSAFILQGHHEQILVYCSLV